MIQTLRVFVDQHNDYGNPLTVLFDTAGWPDALCQSLATAFQTSETVFIDEPRTGRVRIFTPRRKIGFAGHPTVGTAWLLKQRGSSASSLETDAGTVRTEADHATASVFAPASWSAPWRLIQLANLAEVDRASSAGEDRHDYVWCWLDEGSGRIRARAFTSISGTPEDEATGSAASCLADQLGRKITVRQGLGSIIEAFPTAAGTVALSGRVTLSSTPPDFDGLLSEELARLRSSP